MYSNVHFLFLLGADLQTFKALGFKPIASVKGKPTLIKLLPRGGKIGYGCTYQTVDSDGEWVVTIPFGYGDGYFRSLSNIGFAIRDSTGRHTCKCTYLLYSFINTECVIMQTLQVFI